MTLPTRALGRSGVEITALGSEWLRSGGQSTNLDKSVWRREHPGMAWQPWTEYSAAIYNVMARQVLRSF